MEDEPAVVSSAKVRPYYYGFGGWLYIFAAGIIYQVYGTVNVMTSLIQTINSKEFEVWTDPSSDSYNAFWYPGIMMEIIFEIIILLFAIIMAIYCIKLSKYFKGIAITFIISSFVFQLLDLVLMLTLQNGYVEPIFDNDTLYQGVERAFIYTVIWLPYFLLSKRVKNTFIRPIATTINNEVSQKNQLSNFAHKLIVGIGVIFIASYWILGGIVYIWSVVLGYESYGILGGFITLVLPGVSQIYWVYIEWSQNGFNSWYVILSTITVVVWVIFTFLISKFSD